MTVQRTDALQHLLDDCHARVAHPPAWDDVRDRAARLRIAATCMQSLTDAGLLTDEIYLAGVDHWPPDVIAATERLNLFDHYSPTTIAGVLAHLQPQQIGGLVNNVKGTVFEMHVVDSINHGDALGLPGAPDHAALAHTLNQPGWDVETFAHGHHVGYLQMKETAHWQPLAEHAARYPQLPDVATSHEAATAAAAHGMDTSHLYGVTSDTAMTGHVHDTLEHITAAHAAHELVPEIAIGAIIAAGLIRLRAGEPRDQTARWVAEQAATAGAANLAGLAIQIVTGTVALRPLAAIGTRFTIARVRTGHAVAVHIRELRAKLTAIRRNLDRNAGHARMVAHELPRA